MTIKILLTAIRHKEYVDTSFGRGLMSFIELGLTMSTKSLSCFDDKRYIRDDGLVDWNQ